MLIYILKIDINLIVAIIELKYLQRVYDDVKFSEFLL